MNARKPGTYEVFKLEPRLNPALAPQTCCCAGDSVRRGKATGRYVCLLCRGERVGVQQPEPALASGDAEAASTAT